MTDDKSRVPAIAAYFEKVERERLADRRDSFAVAALRGVIFASYDSQGPRLDAGPIALDAFRIADAMMLESQSRRDKTEA